MNLTKDLDFVDTSGTPMIALQSVRLWNYICIGYIGSNLDTLPLSYREKVTTRSDVSMETCNIKTDKFSALIRNILHLQHAIDIVYPVLPVSANRNTQICQVEESFSNTWLSFFLLSSVLSLPLSLSQSPISMSCLLSLSVSQTTVEIPVHLLTQSLTVSLSLSLSQHRRSQNIWKSQVYFPT